MTNDLYIYVNQYPFASLYIYSEYPIVQWCIHVLVSTYELDLQNDQKLYVTVHLLNLYDGVLSPYLSLYMNTLSPLHCFVSSHRKTLFLIWTQGDS